MENLSVNTLIKFVSEGTKVTPTGLSQTGDVLLVIFIAILAIAILASGIFLYTIFRTPEKKTTVCVNASGSPFYSRLKTNIQNSVTLKVCLTTIVAGIIALCAIATVQHNIIYNAIANENSEFPERTIATMQQDTGKITVEKSIFNNYKYSQLWLSSCSVNVTDQGKSVPALSNANIKIISPQSVLYEGKPTGESKSIEGKSYTIKKGESLTISYSITDLDSDSFNQLADKEALNVTINFESNSVKVPEAKELIYNGEEQSPFDNSEYFTIDGEKSAVDVNVVGNYDAVFKLNEGYVWADDQTANDRHIGWNIKPKPLELAWSETNYKYDSLEHAPTASIVGGYVKDEGGLEVSDEYTYFQGSQQLTTKPINAANDYIAKAIKITETAQCTAKIDNYTVSADQATCNFVIEPVRLALTWTPTKTFAYTGKAVDVKVIAINGYEDDVIPESDIISIAKYEYFNNDTQQYVESPIDIGKYTAYAQGIIQNNKESNNYTIIENGSNYFNIDATARVVTVKNINPIEKTYDGTVSAAGCFDYTNVEFEGADPEDELSLVLEQGYEMGEFPQSDAGNNLNINLDYTHVSLSNPIYSINVDDSIKTIKGSILPKPVVYDWDSVSFEYNANKQHPKAIINDAATYVEGESGLKIGDNYDLYKDEESTDSTVDVYSDYYVAPKILQYIDSSTHTAKLENYILNAEEKQKFEIKPFVLKVIWPDSYSPIYNGEEQYPQPTLNSADETKTIPEGDQGRIVIDEFKVVDPPATDGEETTKAINAGQYKVKVLSIGINEDGSVVSTQNYKLQDEDNTFTYLISQRHLIIVGDISASKEYDGNTNANIVFDNVTFDNIVEPDEVTLQGTVDGSFESPDAGASKTMNLDYSSLSVSNPNYILVPEEQSITSVNASIIPRKIKWSWIANTINYTGESVHPDSKITNFVGNEDGLSIKNFYITKDGEEASEYKNVGTYEGMPIELEESSVQEGKVQAKLGNYDAGTDKNEFSVVAVKVKCEWNTENSFTYEKAHKQPYVEKITLENGDELPEAEQLEVETYYICLKSDKETQLEESVDVENYIVSVNSLKYKASQESTNNYYLADNEPTKSKEYNITPKEIAIASIGNPKKVYDGNNSLVNIQMDQVTFDPEKNVIEGDVVNIIPKQQGAVLGHYSSIDVANDIPIELETSGWGLDNPNYSLASDITPGTGITGEITKRPVSLEWGDTEFRYNAKSQHASVVTIGNYAVKNNVAESGLKVDSYKTYLKETSAENDSINVGEYFVEATGDLSKASDDATANPNNYCLPDDDTQKIDYSIYEFKINLIWDYNEPIPYDGEAHKPIVEQITTAEDVPLPEEDSTQGISVVEYSYTDMNGEETVPSRAGFYKANAVTLNVGDKKTQNYTIVSGNPLEFEIHGTEITLKSINAFDKVYDGGTLATFDDTTAVFEGLPEGAVISVKTKEGFGNFESKDVALDAQNNVKKQNVRLDYKYISLEGSDAGKYSLSLDSVSTVEASINPKPVTFEWASESPYTYNKEVQHPNASVAQSSYPNDSEESGLIVNEYTYKDKDGNDTNSINAHDGYTAIVAGLSTGEEATAKVSNYCLPESAADRTSEAYVIDKASVKLIWGADSNIIYNKKAQHVNVVSYEGLYTGDVVKISSYKTFGKNSPSEEVEAINAGDYIAQAVQLQEKISGTFVDSVNYKIQEDTEKKDFTIHKKSVRIASITAQDKTYDANTSVLLNNDATLMQEDICENDELTFTPQNGLGKFVSKDVAYDSTSKEVINVRVTLDLTTGKYTFGGASVENYELSNNLAALANLGAKINPKEVHITSFGNVEKVYDGSKKVTSPITASFSPGEILEGDDVNVKIKEGEAACEYKDKNVGDSIELEINLNNIETDNPNYVLSGELPAGIEAPKGVITPKPVVLAWGQNSKKYNGESWHPDATVKPESYVFNDEQKVQESGLKVDTYLLYKEGSEDSLSETINVGNYTAAGSTLTLEASSTTTIASNYKVDLEEESSKYNYSILANNLKLIWDSEDHKQYDGTVKSHNVVSYAPLAQDDIILPEHQSDMSRLSIVKYTYYYKLTYISPDISTPVEPKAVGAYVAFATEGIKVDGEKVDYYNIDPTFASTAATNTDDFWIDGNLLTLKNLDSVSREYNGATDITIEPNSLIWEGIKPDFPVNATVSEGFGKFEDKDVAVDQNGQVIEKNIVLDYSCLTLDEETWTHYCFDPLQSITTAKGKITPKQVQVNWDTQWSPKKYNGKDQHPTATVSGLVGTETGIVPDQYQRYQASDAPESTDTPIDASINAGNYKVSVKSIKSTDENTKASNYYASDESRCEYTISKVNVDFVWDYTEPYTYKAQACKPKVTAVNGVSPDVVPEGEVLTVPDNAYKYMNSEDTVVNPVNVGIYKATAEAINVNGSPANNYELSGASVIISYIIEEAPITLSAITPNDKVYDGNTVATFKDGSAQFNGVYDSDKTKLNLTINDNFGVFVSKDVNLNGNILSTVKINLDYSKCSLSGDAAANYKMAENQTIKESAATIQQRPVTLSWESISLFPYNGKQQNPNAFISGGYQNGEYGLIISEYDFMQNGSGVTATIEEGEHYQAIAKTLSEENGATAKGTNYKLPQAINDRISQEYTINGSEVVLEWTNNTFTYNKQNQTQTVTAIKDTSGNTLTNVRVKGYDIEKISSYNMYSNGTTSVDAGRYKTTITGLQENKNGTWVDTTDYAVDSHDGKSSVEYTIQQKPIKLKKIVAKDKIYDATKNAEFMPSSAEFTYGSSEYQVCEGDNITFVPKENFGSFSDASVARDANNQVITKTISLTYYDYTNQTPNYSLTGSAAGNYVLSESQDFTEINVNKINPKALTLSWSGEIEHEYDGLAWAPTATIDPSGYVGNESGLEPLYQYWANSTSISKPKSAGNNYSVELKALTQGAGATALPTNYTWNTLNKINFIIKQKSVTVVWENTTFEYNQLAQNPVVGSISGAANGEILTLQDPIYSISIDTEVPNNNADTTHTNAGHYKAKVSGGEIRLVSGGSTVATNNYVLDTSQPQHKYEIKQKPVSITWNNAQGTNPPTITYTYSSETSFIATANITTGFESSSIKTESIIIQNDDYLGYKHQDWFDETSSWINGYPQKAGDYRIMPNMDKVKGSGSTNIKNYAIEDATPCKMQITSKGVTVTWSTEDFEWDKNEHHRSIVKAMTVDGVEVTNLLAGHYSYSYKAQDSVVWKDDAPVEINTYTQKAKIVDDSDAHLDDNYQIVSGTTTDFNINKRSFSGVVFNLKKNRFTQDGKMHAVEIKQDTVIDQSFPEGDNLLSADDYEWDTTNADCTLSASADGEYRAYIKAKANGHYNNDAQPYVTWHIAVEGVNVTIVEVLENVVDTDGDYSPMKLDVEEYFIPRKGVDISFSGNSFTWSKDDDSGTWSYDDSKYFWFQKWVQQDGKTEITGALTNVTEDITLYASTKAVLIFNASDMQQQQYSEMVNWAPRNANRHRKWMYAYDDTQEEIQCNAKAWTYFQDNPTVYFDPINQVSKALQGHDFIFDKAFRMRNKSYAGDTQGEAFLLPVMPYDDLMNWRYKITKVHFAVTQVDEQGNPASDQIEAKLSSGTYSAQSTISNPSLLDWHTIDIGENQFFGYGNPTTLYFNNSSGSDDTFIRLHGVVVEYSYDESDI